MNKNLQRAIDAIGIWFAGTAFDCSGFASSMSAAGLLGLIVS
jgi:hypothetical protein